MRFAHRDRGGKAGFSMLEVMMALFVLTFGLMGLISIQALLVKGGYDTYLQSIAVTQISSAFEIMQLPSGGDSLNKWQETNSKLLPQGIGKIDGDAISICWQERLSRQQRCLTNN